MSYKVHKMSQKAFKIFVPKLKYTLPNFPPKRTLDRQFPFAAMIAGECFLLRDYETTPAIYSRCREFVARYNRTYYCHFVIIRHEQESLYEIARIV